MLELSHKSLTVYHVSLQLIEEVYKTTGTFPKQEQYVLISQLRRAAVSVCSNIAEGAGRTSKKEKRRFYVVARSSLVEIDTQLEIAIRIGYYKKGENNELEQCIEGIFKMLSKMIENLEDNDD